MTRSIAAALAIVAIAGCGSGGNGKRVEAFRVQFNEREGTSWSADASQFRMLVDSKREVCRFNKQTLAFTVADALDHDQPSVFDDAITYFCPDRSDDLRDILATMPDGSASEYG